MEAFFKTEISLIFGLFSGLGIKKITENARNFNFEEGFEDFLRFRTVWRGFPNLETDFLRCICATWGVFFSAVRARFEC